jgi:hypothetical protein
LRSKLDGSGYSFDTNHFDTNYLSHPGSGTLYYWAARGNRLSVLGALSFAFVSSAVWEYAGEFRERVSVNDVFVTPLSGIAIGEVTTQLGAFFDRSCDTTANRVLGTVFGPSKTAHDLIDDAELARDSECDRFGLSKRGDHRFVLYSGGAAVFEDSGRSAFETRLGLEASVKNLSTWNRRGRELATFHDGNVAELSASVALASGGPSEVRVSVRSVPAGIHFRDVEPRLRKRQVIFGPSVRASYTSRRYDRRSDRHDRTFFIDAPAVAIDYSENTGALRLELGLDAGGSFGGVDSMAQARYLLHGSREALPSVARGRGYNHVVGLVLSPRARVSTAHVELGMKVDSHRVWAVRFLDRYSQPHDVVPGSETLRTGNLWVGFGVPNFPPRLSFFVELLERASVVGAAREERRELSTGLALQSVL